MDFVEIFTQQSISFSCSRIPLVIPYFFSAALYGSVTEERKTVFPVSFFALMGLSQRLISRKEPHCSVCPVNCFINEA